MQIDDKKVETVAAVLLGRVNAPEQEIYSAAHAVLEAVSALSTPAPAGTGEACKHCRGNGTTADYVGLEMRPIETECDACKGTGIATPAQPVATIKTLKIEVCKGQAGLALYVDDRRVAGVRHNGLMETILEATVPASPAPVVHSDDLAVDRFAAAMKAKLAKKREEGRGGWEGPTCSAEFLSTLLREHVEKGDPLDVGNLAMMLHQRGERIV